MTAEASVTDVTVTSLATERRTGSTSVHALVRVEVAGGAVGWGELSDLDCYRPAMPELGAIERSVRGWLLGEDATNLNALQRRMSASMLDFRYGARSYPPFSFDSQLAAAVEMACIDVTGRLIGRSASAVLGGSVRTSIPVAYPLFAVAERTEIEASLAHLEQALVSGLTIFRLYVSDLAVGADHVRAVAERLHGRGELKGLDFGGRSAWKPVARFVRSLTGIDVPLVESATWHEDFDGLALLRRTIDSDVCEHISSLAQLDRLVAVGAIDVANVSIQSGGVLAARRLLERADGAGLTGLIGTTQELSIGTAAGAHLAAVAGVEFAHPADIAGPLLYRHDPVVTPLRFDGSILTVPTAPGLGVDVDVDSLGLLASPLLHPGRPAHGPGYVAR